MKLFALGHKLSSSFYPSNLGTFLKLIYHFGHKVPSLEKNEDYAYEAAAHLNSLVGDGKSLKASVILKEKAAWGGNKHPRVAHPKKYVVLSEATSDKSINAQMLECKCSIWFHKFGDLGFSPSAFLIGT